MLKKCEQLLQKICIIFYYDNSYTSIINNRNNVGLLPLLSAYYWCLLTLDGKRGSLPLPRFAFHIILVQSARSFSPLVDAIAFSIIRLYLEYKVQSIQSSHLCDCEIVHRISRYAETAHSSAELGIANLVLAVQRFLIGI